MIYVAFSMLANPTWQFNSLVNDVVVCCSQYKTVALEIFSSSTFHNQYWFKSISGQFGHKRWRLQLSYHRNTGVRMAFIHSLLSCSDVSSKATPHGWQSRVTFSRSAGILSRRLPLLPLPTNCVHSHVPHSSFKYSIHVARFETEKPLEVIQRVYLNYFGENILLEKV